MVSRLRMEFTSTGTPDGSLPFRDRDDPMLTPGSVILLEPGHPSASIGFAGVPAHNAIVPNGAAGRMVALNGGTAAEYALIHLRRDAAIDAVFSRTPKGGLERLYTQSKQQFDNSGSYFELSPKLKQWVFDHIDDDWFFAQQSIPTRAAIGNGTNEYSGILNNGSTGASLTQLEDIGPVPASGAAFLGADFDPAVIGSHHYRSLGSRGWQGGKPAALTNLTSFIMMAGNGGPYAGQSTNKSGSHVAYWSYLENLTVSKRSFAKVNQFARTRAAAAFAAGGRYAGDTFTAPSTFP